VDLGNKMVEINTTSHMSANSQLDQLNSRNKKMAKC